LLLKLMHSPSILLSTSSRCTLVGNLCLESAFRLARGILCNLHGRAAVAGLVTVIEPEEIFADSTIEVLEKQVFKLFMTDCAPKLSYHVHPHEGQLKRGVAVDVYLH
jgi:hypothetical protein